ncbi:MAG: rod shape-determining protein MreC [Candidatus Fermentibacteria bacterium]|nr:rod shape-determining protein MreC [Candidatus Fermentibacteria bacterium]
MRNRDVRLVWNIAAAVVLLFLGPSVLGVGGSILGSKFASLFFSEGNATNSDYLSLSVKLMLENAELREMAAKSRLYRSMLNYVRIPDVTAMVGRVMYRSEGLIRGDLVIDRGSDHGVYSGAVCISSSGLIGIITAVESGSSTVVPITSPAIHVSCITADTGSLGILGSESGGRLRLQYVDSSADPEVGEIVLTSRFGGVYPEGLVVGRVVDISEGGRGLDLSLAVSPAVDFERVDEVLILISEDHQE